jgi:Flp pilus assembly protein TadB
VNNICIKKYYIEAMMRSNTHNERTMHALREWREKTRHLKFNSPRISQGTTRAQEGTWEAMMIVMMVVVVAAVVIVMVMVMVMVMVVIEMILIICMVMKCIYETVPHCLPSIHPATHHCCCCCLKEVMAR